MKKFLRILLVICLLVPVAYFAFRNVLVRKAALHYAEIIRERYGFQVSLSGIRMTGLAGICIDRVEIVPLSGDTLLVMDSLYARPSLPHLVIGRLKMTELRLASMQLQLVQRDSISNFRPQRRQQETTDSAQVRPVMFSHLIHDLMQRAFNLSPQRAFLQQITIRLEKDDARETLYIPYFVSDGDSLHSRLMDSEENNWRMDGTFSQDEETFHVRVVPEAVRTAGFPLAKTFFNGYLSFDTLELQFDGNRYRSGVLTTSGVLRTSGLRTLHARVSGDTVEVKEVSFRVAAHIGPQYAELDSLTTLQLNDLRLVLYARVEKGKSPHVAFQLRSGPQPASAFFRSLPEGMFSSLQGVDGHGTLDFSLRFRMDELHPEDLDFDVQMKKNKFRLTDFGRNSLLKMNSEFEYTAYEYGRPARTFRVGLSDPGFVPLEQVSPYLRYAILTSEDGNFFFHNGFNAEAFRNSIAANYKAGRFVRGGSTITMQLVKNVYLTRKKTVARKAEEAFIVWLIESNGLVPKERMFEVYLNIIELGPMVYGVKDASAFYFNKTPSELSLSESIFLASLLPHPKWFRYSFDSTGTLKPYFADYYRVVSNFMLKKNLITEEEHVRLEPRVELAGPARTLVLPADTLPPDSLEESD